MAANVVPAPAIANKLKYFYAIHLKSFLCFPVLSQSSARLSRVSHLTKAHICLFVQAASSCALVYSRSVCLMVLIRILYNVCCGPVIAIKGFPSRTVDIQGGVFFPSPRWLATVCAVVYPLKFK
jgi:hypothetical protein